MPLVPCLFFKVDKDFSGSSADCFWYVAAGEFLHKAVLSVTVTEFVNAHEQKRSQNDDDAQTHEHVYTADIENSEDDQEQKHTDAEVADVLRLQPLEFNRLVNSLIDFI